MQLELAPFKMSRVKPWGTTGSPHYIFICIMRVFPKRFYKMTRVTPGGTTGTPVCLYIQYNKNLHTLKALVTPMGSTGSQHIL